MNVNEEEPTQGSTAESSGVNRRTLMKGAAWSVPVVAAMSVAPLAAASTTLPGSYGLNRNSGISNNGADGLTVTTNPRAWSYGGTFNAADSHYVQVTLTGSGTSFDLSDPLPSMTGPGAGLWSIVSSSPTQLVVQYNTAVSSDGFDTLSIDIDYNREAPAGSSFTLTGSITGTPKTNFDEGSLILNV